MGIRRTQQIGYLLAATVAALAGRVVAGQAPAVSKSPAKSQWVLNGLATAKFEIRGAESRSNPLRRALPNAVSAPELFFRFRIRYDADSIDSPPDGDGEFIVFWLDDSVGAESSTHTGGVPNVGIHVANDGNRFMARFSPSTQQFAEPLVGGQDFLVVGRLSKSGKSSKSITKRQDVASQPYSTLDIWVNPRGDEKSEPHATTTTQRGLNEISAIGFSIGLKTEFDDRILVWDVGVEDSWQAVLGTALSTEEQDATNHAVEPTVAFRADVHPILKAKCFACHSGDDPESEVRLDVFDEVLNQTTPRDARASRLYQLAVRKEMPPPDGATPPLTESELAVVEAWINEGLQWDEQLLPTPHVQSDHWAFQPIRRPDIPTVKHDDWVRTPVDAFIAKRQEASGIVPAPPASRDVLDRRVCLDLLGLPVSAVPIEAPSENVEALLQHQGFGERWGRHWLDLARWAESNGHQHNRNREHAWRYRDWVVDAFRLNKPYDQFLREQIAGDEWAPANSERLIATGFLAAARYSGNELDKRIQRNDILTDVTDTTASVFLGMTLECARCHTHKFDPLTIRDYYQFQAFFAQGQPANVLLGRDTSTTTEAVRDWWSIFNATKTRLESTKRRQGIRNPVVTQENVLAAIKKSKSQKAFASLGEKFRSVDQTWGWQSSSSVDPGAVAPHNMRFPLPSDPQVLHRLRTHLLIRGEIHSPGPELEPRVPSVLASVGAPSGESGVDSTAMPRTRLAQWLTHPDHPLTARVWVNRIWQWHFGRGLVPTSNDFGTQGAKPTHPELLDYLAAELMENDWDSRHIHRLILESSTYRCSAESAREANVKQDPTNRTYWRWEPRRLEAEAIRDTVLAVSGRLNPKLGGPSVGADSTRRSIYLRQRRNELTSQQRIFDSANSNVSCPQRRVSTTALQPLWLLNSELMQASAADLAKRSGGVAKAFHLACNRSPTDVELAALKRLQEEHGLASACLAILNSSEFLYVP